MKQIRIVFPEFNNEIIKAAIIEAKNKYGDEFLPVEAKDLEEACQMVHDGNADSMIAGIDYTSRDVILTSRDIIGMMDSGVTEYDEKTGRPLKKIFSASFVLEKDNQFYVLGDAAACKNPDERMLKAITLQTYETAKSILDSRLKEGLITEEQAIPRVAMLSFSTLGSGGEDDSINRAKYVAQTIKQEYPNINIDGELQLDAAVNEVVGNKKAPGSTVAGRANVLIVPDLNSGNILYKAMEQFGGFVAAGPILQGFAAPISDLSRGSTKEDVMAVIDIEMLIVKAREIL